MGQDFEKKTFVRITRFHYFPIVTAIHRRVISGKVEPSLLFVRVMAIKATVLE
jgi:hypothetical protein